MFVKVNDGIRQQRPGFSMFAAFSECWCPFSPLCFNSNLSADEAELKMAVEYNGSTVAAIDMDSKIGYKQFFSEDSKFQYSGKKCWLNSEWKTQQRCVSAQTRNVRNWCNYRVVFCNAVGGGQTGERTSGSLNHFITLKYPFLFSLFSSLCVEKQSFPVSDGLLRSAVPSPVGRGHWPKCPLWVFSLATICIFQNNVADTVSGLICRRQESRTRPSKQPEQRN